VLINNAWDLLKFIPLLQEPERVGKILDSIQSISDEAQRALADPELPRQALMSGLSVRISVFLSNPA